MKMVLSVLILASAAMAKAGVVPDAPHVYVSGYGEVETVPDTADFNFAIETIDHDVAKAKLEVDRRSARLLDGLKQLGLADGDIMLSQIAIERQYDDRYRDRGTLVGRTAWVKLRQLDKYEEAVQLFVDIGVSEMDAPDLRSNREDALRAQAVDLAITDARSQASAMAEKFGARLGRVHSISTAPIQGDIYDAHRFERRRGRGQGVITVTARKMESGLQFLPGKIWTVANVYVVFLLEAN
jgi:uncharacterized protein YggE